jgi:hypothetical protein
MKYSPQRQQNAIIQSAMIISLTSTIVMMTIAEIIAAFCIPDNKIRTLIFYFMLFVIAIGDISVTTVRKDVILKVAIWAEAKLGDIDASDWEVIHIPSKGWFLHYVPGNHTEK